MGKAIVGKDGILRQDVRRVFAKLTVLRFIRFQGKHRHIVVECRCECGTVREFYWHKMQAGLTRSCGCTRNTTHGKSHLPEYNAWIGMMHRCYNPEQKSYARYGGRGIRVCNRWRKSLDNFLEDMGPKPLNSSLDRINNDFDYDPDNCRWADRRTQRANQSQKVWKLCINGTTKLVTEWAAELNIPYRTLLRRVQSKLTLEEILSRDVLPDGSLTRKSKSM